MISKICIFPIVGENRAKKRSNLGRDDEYTAATDKIRTHLQKLQDWRKC